MGRASLLQLSAKGVEDVDLTMDATTTFWKRVYEKHTAFAIEPKELAFDNGNADYGKTNTVTIVRSGDLVSDMWLVFDLERLNTGTGNARYTNDIGRALIEEVQVEIGNVVYDTKFGEYFHLWEKLAVSDELQTGRLTGDTPVEADLETWATGPQKIYVPIDFWFTDDYSKALPLVALYQHVVKLRFRFRTQLSLIKEVSAPAVAYDPTTETEGRITNMVLLCEYVFLTDNERNYFGRGEHKYLMHEVQRAAVVSTTVGATRFKVDLFFNHPCSEILWFFRRVSQNGTTGTKEYFDFSGEEPVPFITETFDSLTLLLNGEQRFAPRDPLYFRKVTTRRAHTQIPNKNIYCYNFGIQPEIHDPNGSINFSRIDNAQMLFTFSIAQTERYELHIFARSANWYRITKGLSKKFYI